MSASQNVSFGSGNVPAYNLNNNNYAYNSGDNVQSSYSPVAGGYTSYEAPRDTGFSYGNSPRYNDGNIGTHNLHIQEGAVSGQSYGVARDIHHPAPVTKVTFGNKSYTESYAPVSTTYQAPPPPTVYHQQPVYHQPIEVHTQPIREEIRHQTRYEAPVVEAHHDSNLRASGAVSAEKKKKKKKGCPAWLWPLLGILALLALILGLLFGLGVFGGGAGAGAAAADRNDYEYTIVEEEAVLSRDSSVAPVANTNTVGPSGGAVAATNSTGTNTVQPIGGNTVQPVGDNTVQPVGDNTVQPIGGNTVQPVGDNNVYTTYPSNGGAQYDAYGNLINNGASSAATNANTVWNSASTAANSNTVSPTSA